MVAAYFIALALAALATHLAFFFKRPSEKSSFAKAWSLLPHLVLCGILLGTSLVLSSPDVSSRLNGFKLDFLGSLLFYVAIAWSLVAVLGSLLPVPAAPSERK